MKVVWSFDTPHCYLYIQSVDVSLVKCFVFGFGFLGFLSILLTRFYLFPYCFPLPGIILTIPLFLAF